MLTTKKTIQTVLNQKYENYKIFVYNLNNEITGINHPKVETLNKKMNDLKECQGFDVVLMIKGG